MTKEQKYAALVIAVRLLAPGTSISGADAALMAQLRGVPQVPGVDVEKEAIENAVVAIADAIFGIGNFAGVL